MQLADELYIEQLEQLILYTLLPIYNKYYEKPKGFERKLLIDEELLRKISRKRNKLPALLRKNENSGVLKVTSDRR